MKYKEERIGSQRLILGDCLKVMPELGRFDAVVTDPPYGIGYQSGHATDDLWISGRKIRNDHDTLARDEAISMARGAAMLVFGARAAPLPHECRQVLIWDKGGALGMGALDLPWKPAHEEIYVLGKGFVGGRKWHSVIYHPPVQSMAKNGRVHPTEKPVGLICRMLKWCPPGLVLDPFMGSGTTLVACQRMGRSGTGIELDPEYFDIACRRVDEASRQEDLFVASKPMPQQESLL